MTINRREFIEKYAIYFVLLAMVVFMSIIKFDTFFTTKNFLNIVRQMSVIAIIAQGVNLCIILGGTDLSSGSVLAVVSVVVAMLVHPAANGMGAEHFLLFALLVATAAGALCGLINGVMIAHGKIPPFIATLSMMMAARGFALLISDGKPIGNFTDAFEFIGGGDILGIPMPVIILAVVVIVTYILLNKTTFGTYIYAIGGNENAAQVSGINVKKIKMLVYTYAGVMTAIAAIVLTSRVSSGQPGAGVSYELDAISAAIIGGTSINGGIGTVQGTLVGALIMGVLATSLTMLGIQPEIQMIAKGAIIAIAVLIDIRKNK